MSEWRQIETAPKDGTRILLWPMGNKHSRHVRSGYWHQPANPEAPGFWMPGAGRPTHWQPLPEPPSDPAPERRP